MLETIIEKMKEYKILIGLSLIGLIIAGFFMINGQSSRQSNVAELAQETVTQLQRHFCYGFVAFCLVECFMYGCSEFRRISVRKSLFRAAGPVPALQRF